MTNSKPYLREQPGKLLQEVTLLIIQKQAEIIYGAIKLYSPQLIDTSYKRQWINAITEGIIEIKKIESQENATSRTLK